MNRIDPWRAALALLLVVSAVLFAVGTTLERSEEDEHDEPAAAASEERSESEEGEEGSEAVEEAAAVEESDESILGADIESPFFVALGVIASLALAGSVWFLRRREAVLLAGLFALVFFALDARELLHQLDESNTGIASFAVLIGLLHAGAAVVAVRVYRSEMRLAT